MTTKQAITQADLLSFFLHDDTQPHQSKAAMNTKPADTSDWFCESVFEGKAWKWISRSPAYDGWEIFEQPAGFYVWNRFTFVGENTTLEAAVARVELRRALDGF